MAEPAQSGGEGASGGGPIVVGYDGLERSHDALALARLLADTRGAELLVVSVITYTPTEIGIRDYERMVHDDIVRLGKEAKSELEDARVETVGMLAASAAQTLHDVAEDREAEIVVLGSTHRSAVGRVLPGSVGDRLLAGGPSAVAVAPQGYAEGPAPKLERIGVGYEPSPEGRLALEEAAELAVASGARLSVISALVPWTVMAMGWGGLAPMPYTPPEEPAEARKKLEGQLAEAVEGLPDELETESEVTEGDPAATLIAASADLDLLVVGSRGYGPLRRTLLGGVSARVMREASCPVLVVPRAAVEAERPSPVGGR